MTSARTAHVRQTVSEADTATSMRSGDVPVLATPRVVALCEEAACAAMVGTLKPVSTSVGTWIGLGTWRRAQSGAEVVAAAPLTRADGRRLEFDVTLSEGDALVARGRHRGQVVDRARFLDRLVRPRAT